MADFISQADVDRLAKSVDSFHGFKALFQRSGQFTEDVIAAMRAVRTKFHGGSDRLTALLGDVLGMKRPTQLIDTSTMHDRLKQFGFGASRPVSLTGIRASTPVEGDASEKEAEASTAKKSQLFRPLRQPQQRGGGAAGSRSASVEDVGSSFSQGRVPKPFDTSVANATADGLDVTIPPVGEFAHGDLSPFERMLDRLLVDQFLIQLSSTDEGNVLAAEIFRNGGEQSPLQSIFLCQATLNPTLDCGKTAAMRAFFDSIKVAEDGGSSRAAILKMRDALALVTESDLSPAGILSRTVRTLVTNSTDLTELVNRHVAGAEEETLETFDTLVQELFSK